MAIKNQNGHGKNKKVYALPACESYLNQGRERFVAIGITQQGMAVPVFMHESVLFSFWMCLEMHQVAQQPTFQC